MQVQSYNIKIPTREDLKKDLKKMIEEGDFVGVHVWLCHPYKTDCSKYCNRTVDPYRLAIYGEVCDEK
jgi:hypothetical protein